jgi:hypothetical protein
LSKSVTGIAAFLNPALNCLRALLEDFDCGQLPAFEKLEKRRRRSTYDTLSAIPYLAIAASVSPPPAIPRTLSIRRSARNPRGARAELIEFEHADRPVPDDRYRPAR